MSDERYDEVQLKLTDEAGERIRLASGESAERVEVRVAEEASPEETLGDDPQRAVRA
jgi:DNA-binding ferritin-like protein